MALPAYQLLVDNGLEDDVIICSTADAELRAVELIQDCDTYLYGSEQFCSTGKSGCGSSSALFQWRNAF